jgi:predicted dehydrogenase
VQSDRFRLALGMDIDRDAAQAFGSLHGVPVTLDYDEVLGNGEVDGVLIATPPSGHLAQVLQAVEAGKQVFCEKPLTLTRAAAVQMLEACQEQGMVLGLDHHMRYDPSREEVRRLVVEGTLGKVLHVEANHSHSVLAGLPEGHWRGLKSEGPASGFGGTGIHYTDLFISMLGPMEEVFAFSEDRVLGFANGDVASLQFRFVDGTTGTVASIMTTQPMTRLAVFGERGWVEVVDGAHNNGGSRSRLTLSRRDGETQVQEWEGSDTVRMALEAWASAVEEGAPYRFRASEMIDNMAVMEAMTRSVESGRAVQITELM